jgi:hypothetical protein
MLVLCGCSDKPPVQDPSNEVLAPVDPPEIKEDPPQITDNPTIPEVDITKTEISSLTGLPCTPEQNKIRPVAVVHNNHKAALPQVGIGNADIVWECNMEGGITRLVAIYSDISCVEELGAIRSAREYFLDIASIHGAILVHAGGSPSYYAEDKNRGYDNIDEVNMHTIPTDTFWRDSEKRYSRGYEHCLETSGEKLVAAFKTVNYKTETDEQKKPFEFYSERTVPDGSRADYVKIAHSGYITPEFNYNADDSRYYKVSFGEPHIDEATGEQLAFENVIVLFASQKVVDSDLRLDINLVGEGSGILVTAGQKIDIVWKRSASDSVICLENSDQTPVKLNPGKTHITVFDKDVKNGITIN